MTEVTDDNEVVSLLQELVRIPSYESEVEVVRYLSERFASKGIPYKTRRVGSRGRENFIAIWQEGSLREQAHSLILNSHMDTVSPGNPIEWSHSPFSGELVGVCGQSKGRVYGRGAADAKGPLAAMIVAFESIVRSGIARRGRLILTAVAYEEESGLGTKTEVLSGTKADAAIVGEPTGLEVHIAHKGVARFNVTTRGKSAHASEPWEGLNAVSKMGKVILALDELAQRVSRKEDSLLGRATLAVTLIEGGTGRNVIPAECTITLDRRLLPSQTPREAQEEIETVLMRLERDDPTLRAELEFVSSAEGAVTPSDSPIVQEALSARTEVLEESSEVGGFTACSDMWHLKNQGGIPTIILGPGDLTMAHKRDEFIEVEELQKAVRIYRNIALRWLSGSSPSSPL
jgi:succinyl-diaminopimelate desuccinylase